MKRLIRVTALLVVTITAFISQPALAFNQDDLDQLIKTKKCKRCDLSGANLEGLDLKDVVFIWSDLRKANLNNADLRGAKFYDCNLELVTFTNANLLSGPASPNVSFSGSNLTGINLSQVVSANLKGTSFDETNLSTANLQGIDLQGVDFQNANLKNANLRSARMEGADLRGANLIGVRIRKAYVHGTIFDEIGRKYAKKNGAQFGPDNRLDME